MRSPDTSAQTPGCWCPALPSWFRATPARGAKDLYAVSVEEVEKVYDTADRPIHAVGPVTFSFNPGETLGIVGPVDGCAKAPKSGEHKM